MSGLSDQVPPSLPSSSAPPKIRINSGSRLFTSSPTTPESPRTPTAILRDRDASLVRSGSNASSTRSGTSSTLPITSASGARTPTRIAPTPRARSPPPPISSHAGGILPPASFFRVGQPRATPPSMTGSMSMSMPYGPPKPTAPVVPHSSNHPLPRPPVIFSPVGSPPGSPMRSAFTAAAAASGGDISRGGPGETIALGSMSTSRRGSGAAAAPEVSFSIAEDSMAGDVSGGYSLARSFHTKASHDPLIPPPPPDSPMRSATDAVRNGVDRVFGRPSRDSSGMGSSDLEQGLVMREVVEVDHAYSPPAHPQSAGAGADLTRTSSFTRSDEDHAHTYTFRGGPDRTHANSPFSTTKIEIERGPKSTIHPHPIIIPAIAILNPKTGKPLRNHSLIPSKNHFFLRGKALTGGDSPLPFLGTLTLIFGLAAGWFACTAPWWWWHVSPAVPVVAGYMTLFCIASLLMTAFRDPGILPRNLDLDPPMASVDDNPPAPLPRDLRVRAGVVRVKYCPSCKIYRPPRSSHCRLCDNCVDSCDHHCQWVNNCVGRRNYTHFFTFLIAVSLTDIFIIVTTALHIYLVSHRDHIALHKALSKTVGSAVVFIISLLTIWPVLTLLGYHCRLIILNITTIEQVRSAARTTIATTTADADDVANPFTLGKWTRNVSYLFCRPAGYTWIQADELAMEDRRIVNPGASGDWKDEEGVYGRGEAARY